MTWNPAQKVVDLRTVVDNLLGYIGDNQADAHAWANGSAPMPDYTFYTNASGRLATKFPQLIVLDQEHSAEDGETDGGDVIVIRLALTLEGAMTGPNTDELVLTTRKYAMALESMLVNIPAATLTANSLTATHGTLMQYQTAFDQIKGYEKQASSWLQIFQTRCEYQLLTAAF